jgi:hypothetical protein
MRNRLLLLPVLLIVAAFPLAGCGGGDDTDTGAAETAAVDTSATRASDEDQITEVITTAGTTTSKEVCTQLETQRFVDQNSGKSGAASLQDCATLEPGESDADSVDVTNIEVDGDTATADAAFTGSIVDGQTLSLSLVKEGDQWKLDHFDAFVDFDPQALADSFTRQLGGPNGDLTPTQLNCVRQVITTAPPKTIEDAIISGQQSQIQALFADC